MSANNVYGGYIYYIYSSTYKDRLDSVSGTTVYYDSNNPYYPTSFGNMSFTYEGRRLKTITISGKVITNYYDDEGIRYKKEITENAITRTILYYYDNHKLITEIENGVRRDYIYDSLGNIYGYVLAGVSYYYIKDSLGIIHGIKNASGNVLASYTYDAYGNIINQNDTTTNHIKYKGYYYDEEIGMYYLISRFYYPYWRRFLTPDNYTYLDFNDINQLNLFAYCNNNPVMYSDGEGHFGILTSVIVGALIGFACSYIPDVVGNFKDGFDWNDFNTFEDNWMKYVGATLGGAIGGLGAGIGTTMLFGGAGNVVSGIFSGDISSVSDGLIQFTLGALTSGISYGISKGISTKLASGKISNIIGKSSKNAKINSNLAKNGFENMKVGKMGMKTITKELYKQLGYENLQDGIGYALDFGLGFLF